MKHLHTGNCLPILGALSLLLASCVTTAVPPAPVEMPPHPAASLQELYGLWQGDGVTCEYPFVADGKKYLRITWAQTDDTELWRATAAALDMAPGELWNRRFARAPLVYARDGQEEQLPLVDENGTQKGRTFLLHGGRIYSAVSYLIPERILLVNLPFFLLAADGGSFTETGSFYLASDVFAGGLAAEPGTFVKEEAR